MSKVTAYFVINEEAYEMFVDLMEETSDSYTHKIDMEYKSLESTFLNLNKTTELSYMENYTELILKNKVFFAINNNDYTAEVKDDILTLTTGTKTNRNKTEYLFKILVKNFKFNNKNELIDKLEEKGSVKILSTKRF